MTGLSDETLLTLKDACEIYFGGKITPATLKAEHDRGNLALSKIGRSYFTTLADLKFMREKCLVDRPARGSGPTKRGTPGPSSMADPAIAQDAALRKLDELKKHFGSTSAKNTRQRSVTRR